MGREIRRVPVDFNHPIVWRERLKFEPSFGTMRATLVGEPSPATGTRVTRWVHELQPMFDKSLAEAQAEWDQEREKELAEGILDTVYDEDDLRRAEARLAGRYASQVDREYVEHVKANLGKQKWESVEEYIGRRPGERGEDDARFYCPEGWPPVEQRGYVVYETVSEGTPITPCFATQEGLIDWLTEKGTAWDAPMSRGAAEGWVRGSGWTPSVIVDGRGVRSGLEIAEATT